MKRKNIETITIISLLSILLIVVLYLFYPIEININIDGSGYLNFSDICDGCYAKDVKCNIEIKVPAYMVKDLVANIND